MLRICEMASSIDWACVERMDVFKKRSKVGKQKVTFQQTLIETSCTTRCLIVVMHQQWYFKGKLIYSKWSGVMSCRRAEKSHWDCDLLPVCIYCRFKQEKTYLQLTVHIHEYADATYMQIIHHVMMKYNIHHVRQQRYTALGRAHGIQSLGFQDTISKRSFESF